MIVVNNLKVSIRLLITLTLGLFLSCSDNVSDDSEFVVPVIIPTGNEKYLQENSDYIYDQKSLRTYELKLPQSALDKIDADPAAEEYVEGMLIFEGDTISPVGIRYKGSVGAFVGCLTGDDWFNPSGKKICSKLSMKVKINWDGRESLFYNLKKIQFHAQNLDKSQLHDRLAYWLFRSMGVNAPRAVHARLMINGKYSGLYSLVEVIDSAFDNYNFDDTGGNLYKEVWPLTYKGTANNEQAFLNALRTNEDENPSVELIKSFGERLEKASNQAEINNIISEYMDIKKIISLAVVDRMIRNDDGWYHWYCFGDCGNHNYFWYEEPTNKKINLIPWDLDNAFENIEGNNNPVTPIADKWGETRNDCKPFPFGPAFIYQWSASCDKLIGGWASYEKEYEQIKKEFVSGPFSKAQVDALIDEWVAQIRDATVEATNTHSDALNTTIWETEIGILKSQLEFARNQ